MWRLIDSRALVGHFIWAILALTSSTCIQAQTIHEKLANAYQEASSRYSRQDYQGAILVADAALRVTGSEVDTEWLLIARMHNVRGAAHQQLDQTSSAIADFTAARDIYSRQSDSTSRLNRAVNEVSLGALAEKSNRYTQALTLYSNALPEIEKAARVPNADSSVVQAYAGVLTNIGSVHCCPVKCFA